MQDSLLVAKVGGSLYDMPDLRPRLNAWVQSRTESRIVLFPGGGPTADVIRQFDRIHGLGEEAAHWLALGTLSVNARMLAGFFSNVPVLGNYRQCEIPRVSILDPLPFFERDEADPCHLPHRWEVTSDSLAVRASTLLHANRLILLKSTDPHSTADTSDLVDIYFEQALRHAKPGLVLEIVNFRRDFETILGSPQKHSSHT